jgi:hypothetical protein
VSSDDGRGAVVNLIPAHLQAFKEAIVLYEILYYDGWSSPPAYILLDGINADSPEEALSMNVDQVTEQVREQLGISSEDVSDDKIQELLYVLRTNGLLSMHEAQPRMS